MNREPKNESTHETVVDSTKQSIQKSSNGGKRKLLTNLLYGIFLAIFIALLIFSSGQKEEAVIAVATAEKTTSDEEIKSILQLPAYDSIQNELDDLKGKIPENSSLLYFHKSGDVVHVHLVNETQTTTNPIVVNLDETNTYDFDSTFGKLDALKNSQIGEAILKRVDPTKPGIDWEKSDYSSTKFPKLLGWQGAYAEGFETTRKTSITQDGKSKFANTTKPIHFFLWSTIEYMKAENDNRLYYTISKDADAFKVTSTFNDFDHANTKAAYEKDALEKINAYKKKIETAKATSFTFTKSSDQLTVNTDTESLAIPIRFVNSKNLYEAGTTVGIMTEAAKILTPILDNLKKADSKIKNWTTTEFDKNNFSKTLDLPIRNSRWQQFLTANKAKDVFDFFTEAIAFQLDETDYTALTLKANTISLETSSELSNIGNRGLIFWLSLLGILGTSFLLVRENVAAFSKNKVTSVAKEKDQTDSLKAQKETQEVTPQKEVAVQPVAKPAPPTKSEAEIFDEKIRSIKSFKELLSLSLQSHLRMELNSLIETKEAHQKVTEAKGKIDVSFINAMKEIFPKQATYITSQMDAAALWKKFIETKDKGGLKKFLNKNASKAHKDLPNLLSVGFTYEDLSKANTFAEALNALKAQKEFTKDAEILLNVQRTNTAVSIGEIVKEIIATNERLSKGIENAASVADLLPHINNWYNLRHNNRDSKWKDASTEIRQKLQNVQAEQNTSKRLAQIEALYNYMLKQDEKVVALLMTQYQKELQNIRSTTDEEIKSANQAADQKVADIQNSTKQQLADFEIQKEKDMEALQAAANLKYKALQELKKISDANNKLIEKYFANLYDPHIKEFQNKARDLEHTELNKHLAFIAFNAMDLAKFVNDKWSADQKIEGNIRRILRRESMGEIPKQQYDRETATSYVNTMVGFLHKNGIKEIDHLIDGIDINKELKGLQ